MNLERVQEETYYLPVRVDLAARLLRTLLEKQRLLVLAEVDVSERLKRDCGLTTEKVRLLYVTSAGLLVKRILLADGSKMPSALELLLVGKEDGTKIHCQLPQNQHSKLEDRLVEVEFVLLRRAITRAAQRLVRELVALEGNNQQSLANSKGRSIEPSA